MSKFMKLAFEQAYLALEKGELPVGAVVVRGGEVLGRAYNLTLTTSNPTAHAEMLAIQRSAKTIGDWRLSRCSIYVTLEPCPMCTGAILLSRISDIHFSAYDHKDGACGSTMNLAVHTIFGHRARVYHESGGEESSQLIREFFRRRREK